MTSSGQVCWPNSNIHSMLTWFSQRGYVKRAYFYRPTIIARVSTTVFLTHWLCNTSHQVAALFKWKYIFCTPFLKIQIHVHYIKNNSQYQDCLLYWITSVSGPIAQTDESSNVLAVWLALARLIRVAFGLSMSTEHIAEISPIYGYLLSREGARLRWRYLARIKREQIGFPYHACGLSLVHSDIQDRTVFGHSNAEASHQRNSQISSACGSNAD